MSLQTKDLVEGAKRRPLLCICGGLVFVFALLLYFRSGLGAELGARLQEREKELTRLGNNVKFSAQLDTQLDALRRANAAIESGALRAGELATNQRVFLRLEADSGAKLLELRQLPVPASKPAAPAAAAGKKPAAAAAPVGTYVAVPFSVAIEGSYPQLIEFMKRLENAPTVSRITSATIAQPTEGAQSVSLSVDLLGFRS